VGGEGVRSDDRGLFSVDVMFALLLATSIALSFLNVYGGRSQAAELMGARLEAKLVGEKLAAAINAVYAGGENFELFVALPENLNGYSYLITFIGAERQISVENSAWGTVRVTVPFENVEIPMLESGTFENALRVYWRNEFWIRVVST
jgi:hypothetical protein